MGLRFNFGCLLSVNSIGISCNVCWLGFYLMPARLFDYDTEYPLDSLAKNFLNYVF